MSRNSTASLHVSSNAIIIKGKDLGEVIDIKLAGQSATTNFQIVMQTPTEILATAASLAQFHAGSLYNLILNRDAQASWEAVKLSHLDSRRSRRHF